MSQKLHKLFDTLDTALNQMKKPEGKIAQGQVVWAKDGIFQANGMTGVAMGEVISIPEAESLALVMQVENDTCSAVLLAAGSQVKPGHSVVGTGKTLQVPVGQEMLGRVVDPLGLTLDEKGKLGTDKFAPLETEAPQVLDREPVGVPLQTGIVAVDALIPIGRGQRELIIGDRQTGKTTVAVDAIINQKGKDVVCVYVAIGQRDGNVAQVVNDLIKHGAMEFSIVVSASSAQPPVLQYLAPYAGQAMAEWFMHQGKDVLIVFDDLTKHAVAYREISLLLRRPPGREAYPGDVFYLHSRLLERAAQLTKELGGGSITALPIVETLGGDVSAYIPTNVISITDGQIYLEAGLFYRGVRPAINVGISVSRVGGAAQTKIMKQVSGSAKLQLAQYYELAAFSQFSSELDDESKRRLVRGERLVESLKQGVHAPLQLWQQVVTLKAAMDGYLDQFSIDESPALLKELVEHLQTSYSNLVTQIEDQKKMTDELEASLKSAYEEFFNEKKGKA